jgi:glutathione-regulated potassium-efflux system ancillary protein KefC
VVLGFLLLKAAVLWGMARTMPMPVAERPVYVILLAQGGEFGFVVFQSALGAGVIDAPHLVAAGGRGGGVDAADAAAAGGRRPLDRPPGPAAAAAGAPAEIRQSRSTRRSSSPASAATGRSWAGCSAPTATAPRCWTTAWRTSRVRRFGWPAFYGDATRLDLLRTAGADRACVLRAGHRRRGAERGVRRLVREHFPAGLPIVARARNVTHYYRLLQLGVTMIERETLDSALLSRRSVLQMMGMDAARRRATSA